MLVFARVWGDHAPNRTRTGDPVGQPVTFPVIDPSIKHVGVSKLRELNAAKLRATQDTFVIQDNNTPLAVLLTYDKFLTMQDQLMSVLNTLELLSDKSELAGVLAGVKDMRAGRVRSLADIEAGFAKKK
jgi:PHD/YefM family antitoxin component YafN of YafNO toxin-antitoxin module